MNPLVWLDNHLLPWYRQQVQRQQPPAPDQAPQSPTTRCPGTFVLAKVGDDVILADEVIAGIDMVLKRSKLKLEPEQLEQQRKLMAEQVRQGIAEIADRLNNPREPTPEQQQREMRVMQFLKTQIDTKLLGQGARQGIPAENLPEMEDHLGRQFDDVAVDKLFEQYDVDTRRALDEALRAKGSSLKREKRLFMDQALAQFWISQQIKRNEEVTHGQMTEYYRDHQAEFHHTAGATWQQLTIRFSEHPNRDDAYRRIVQMGNAVLDGTPFAEVAKADSEGPTASEGGERPWPEKGAPPSSQLQQAVEGLPTGQMSQIIQDWRGYHIIRVTERHGEGYRPFSEVQAEVANKIRKQRVERQWQAFVKKLQQQIHVWTVFDDLAAGEAKQDQTSGRRDGPDVY